MTRAQSITLRGARVYEVHSFIFKTVIDQDKQKDKEKKKRKTD
jgi:hypothetical protein